MIGFSVAQLATALVAASPSGYNFRVVAASKFPVKVLFFGRVRELTGLGEESVELPPGATVADLFDRYAARYSQLARFRASLVASRNQEFVPWDTPLAAGDHVAFLPPVSGG